MMNGHSAALRHWSLDGSTAWSAVKASPGSKPGGGGSGGGSGLLTTYTSGLADTATTDNFNIKIDFSGSWTAKQQAVVTWAADFISGLITSGLRNETFTTSTGQTIAVDDLTLSVSTGRIDGSGNPLTGNMLAKTQINYVRDIGTTDQYLPLTATMKLDSTDLANAAKSGWAGTWDTIILHEMIHALGFIAPVFQALNLVNSAGNLVGPQASALYGEPVPIEGGDASGTSGSHWAETGFVYPTQPLPNELMTGVIGPGETTYLSDVTLAALRDLCYSMNIPPSGSLYLVDSGLLIA